MTVPEAKGRVLVVDDERHQRDILEMILESEGYETATAGGGRQALKLCAHGAFDVVLTDLKMPDLDGLALLSTLLQTQPNACVILMTAHGSIDSAVEAMRRGAFDYLTKPLNKDELLLVKDQHVLAISFWNDMDSARNYESITYPQLDKTLRPVMVGKPTVETFKYDSLSTIA